MSGMRKYKSKKAFEFNQLYSFLRLNGLLACGFKQILLSKIVYAAVCCIRLSLEIL